MYNIKFNDPDIFASIIERAVKCLKGVKFDTVVFRGFSGAIVGPAVALRLGKPWALVRKVGDSSHSLNTVEGYVSSEYVIIDDFIDSGETVNKIVSTFPDGLCAGVYLYNFTWLRGSTDPDYRNGIRKNIGGIKVLNWKD
jgi:phosphoribosylpyrophosphate synthetase